MPGAGRLATKLTAIFQDWLHCLLVIFVDTETPAASMKSAIHFAS
jgi:hypothetical protein